MSKQEPKFGDEHIYSIPVGDFYKLAVSVDCAVFGYDQGKVEVLLIKRGTDLYKGDWALPGDLVYPDENIDGAALRVLSELTGLDNMFLDQVKAFGEVNRHPDGRVITVGYFSIIKKSMHVPKAASWAETVQWHPIDKVPDLAFDHNHIFKESLNALRTRSRQQPVGFNLLPDKFTLLEMQAMYENLLGQKFDKPNFRKKVLDMKLLDQLDELQSNVKHRPAKLFKFNETRYHELKENGFDFAL